MNGIIDENQFSKLVRSLDVYSENVFEFKLHKLLESYDPFNNKQFTYSECIGIFTREFADTNNRMAESVSILDAVASIEN